jgi:hypothetical protein
MTPVTTSTIREVNETIPNRLDQWFGTALRRSSAVKASSRRPTRVRLKRMCPSSRVLTSSVA